MCGGGERQPILESDILVAFQEEHPWIKVQPNLIPIAGMNERYLTAMIGGNPPDVIMIDRMQIPVFAAQNALLPLGDFIAQDGLNPLDIWYESEWDIAQWQGEPYALPLTPGAEWYLLFYNKDLFAEAGLDPETCPTTWQDLEEYARQMTVIEDGEVQQLGLDVSGVQYNVAAVFKQWLVSNNGIIVSPDGKDVAFNTPEGVETLRWMVDFTDDINGGVENVQGWQEAAQEGGGNNQLFYDGRLAMQIQGVWFFLSLATFAPELNYGVCLVPYNGNNPDATHAVYAGQGWGYGIPSGSRHPEAAWELTKYLTAGEGNLNFLKAMQRPSPVQAHNTHPYFAQVNPHWEVVQEALGLGRGAVPAPVAATEMNRFLSEMTTQALFHRMSPEEAVNAAAEELQGALDDGWATTQ